METWNNTTYGLSEGIVYADAADLLLAKDAFFSAHPMLKDASNKIVPILSGGLWIQALLKAGPVGFTVGAGLGIAADYGYNKLLELAGDNLALAEANLAVWLQSKDEELTPEKAARLASFAMYSLKLGGRLAFHKAASKGFNKALKAVENRQLAKNEVETNQLGQVAQSMPFDVNKVLKSAAEPGRNGLTNAGRQLQKHAGRADDAAFNNIQFSHKTADQEAIRIIKEITGAESNWVDIVPGGGYIVFDRVTGRGFSVSRNGEFNGFRSLEKTK